jgi:hypothetical protein
MLATMRRRSALLSSLVLLALGSLAAAQDRAPRDRSPAADDMPAAPLRVHEWGVWQLDPSGRLSSRATVAAEAPAFVHRTPAALSALEDLTPAPYIPGGSETFDKPVIFLYATTALDVNVTVRVPRGRPWLYFPDATLGRMGGAPSLRWTGRALPVGTSENGATLPSVLAPTGGAADLVRGLPRTDWWNLLRAVGASPFVPTGAATYEKFLYYDGEAPFPAGFRVRRGVVTPIAGRVEPIAWQLDGPHWTRLDVRGATVTATDIGNMVALNVELGGALARAGLSQPEINALFFTWGRSLFGGPRRILWLLPRASYDAMLPIEVHPAPLELVRVGLVIQRY